MSEFRRQAIVLILNLFKYLKLQKYIFHYLAYSEI